jgi:hypothetical protein
MTTPWRNPLGKRSQLLIDRLERNKERQALIDRHCARREARLVRPSRSGMIYFVEAVGCDRIKIGFTKKLEERVLSLQTGCPFPVRLLRAQKGTLRDEADLHARFWSAHIEGVGEWFRASTDLLAYIEGEFP